MNRTITHLSLTKNRARIATSRGAEAETQSLIAYRIHRQPPLRLVPAPAGRSWMDATHQHFANRCLPLMANQAGWLILNSHPLQVTWTGGDTQASLQLTYLGGAEPYPASSHFGHGILTWHIPYLFRTPPGYHLHVRGPANWPKDGIAALEGIVETDWAVASFTMNWKLTRPNVTVTFEAGEPICMIMLIQTGQLEAVHPQIRPLESVPELQQHYQTWSASRDQHNAALEVPDSTAAKRGWEKHYFHGTSPSGIRATEHRTKLKLREFDEPDGLCYPPV